MSDEVPADTPADMSADSPADPPADTPADTPPPDVQDLRDPQDVAAPATGPAGALETRAEAFVTGGAYGVLAVAGVLLGVFGSFYQGGEIGPVPVVALVFSLLNLGAFRLAGWAMGTKLGALVPAVGWLVAVIFMSSKRPEGDLVISATTASYVFLIGGAVAAIAAVALSRSPRNWLLPNSVP